VGLTGYHAKKPLSRCPDERVELADASTGPSPAFACCAARAYPACAALLSVAADLVCALCASIAALRSALTWAIVGSVKLLRLNIAGME
jgi:hypothetical protein